MGLSVANVTSKFVPIKQLFNKYIVLMVLLIHINHYIIMVDLVIYAFLNGVKY